MVWLYKLYAPRKPKEKRMEIRVKEYIEYLEARKHISANTRSAYLRDLERMYGYLREHGIEQFEDATAATLNSFLLFLEKNGLGGATIARNAAVVRGFYQYLFRKKIIEDDITEMMEAPKVERKLPKSARREDIDKILSVPEGGSPKALRDRAMIEVLRCTGILVEELIKLRTEDVKLELGYVQCHFPGNQNAYPLDGPSLGALRRYLEEGRGKLIRREQDEVLFPNVRGTYMSRQGFWKVIRRYSEETDGEQKITPSMIRHT